MANQAKNVHAKIDLLIDKLVHLQDTTKEFFYTMPDGTPLDTKSWTGWEWTHGIGLYGLWKYYELTGRPELLDEIQKWFRYQFEERGTVHKNINTMAVFLTLANVYAATGDQTYLPRLEAWAEWAMASDEGGADAEGKRGLYRTQYGGMQHTTYLEVNHEQLWDDTLMMTALPLARIGRVLQRPHYVEEALRQMLLQIQYLFDPTTGLFFHGWEFTTDTDSNTDSNTDSSSNTVKVTAGHNFARARWARGNAWLTIVLPEMLELLEEEKDNASPALGALKTYFQTTLEAQCRALAKLQEPDSGLWRTLLDEPANEGSYPETSATAGFAYGLLKARRKRYLPRTTPEGISYDAVAQKAVEGVLANISAEGELLQTSFGTPMGRTLQFYKDIPLTAMPYGQAMAMMALVEYLRTFY